MEKMTWTRPVAAVEQFMPNEYIAACGDNNVVYKFKCDAGSSRSSYHVYLNGPDGLPETVDDVDWSGRSGRVKTFSPCGSTHEASTTEEFPAGYMYQVSGWGNETGSRIDVIVWTEGGTNTHCTKNLNMDTWETTKS